MTFTISPNRTCLRIFADLAERKEMQDHFEENGEEMEEVEVLESLLANSDLQWVDPADTGDLTSAPMLGIYGDESRMREGPYGATFAGQDALGRFWLPILERWAHVRYETTSIAQELRNTGMVILSNGAVEPTEA